MKVSPRIRLSLKGKKASRAPKAKLRSPRNSKTITKIAKNSRKKMYRKRRKWIMIAKMMMTKNRKNHKITTTIGRRNQETITTMTDHKKLSLLERLMFS